MFASRLKRFLAVVVCPTMLCGCGAGGMVTPNVQEFWGSPGDAAHLEANVAAQVTCELSQAVRSLFASSASKSIDYIYKWNAQVQLLFTIDEKGSFEPQLTARDILPPIIKRFSGGRTVTTEQNVSLGLDFSYSNEAIRTDKIFLTYKVKDFVNSSGPFRTCIPQDPSRATLFVVQSDLKIYEWLSGALGILSSQGPDSEIEAHPKVVTKADALSHDIQFKIVTSGSITPGATLVYLVTGSSPVFKSSRERTQQLVITMGPPDKANPDQLGPTAQTSSLASQLSAVLRIGTVRVEP